MEASAEPAADGIGGRLTEFNARVTMSTPWSWHGDRISSNPLRREYRLIHKIFGSVVHSTVMMSRLRGRSSERQLEGLGSGDVVARRSTSDAKKV